ncbi:hypothetical protein [Chitinimonas koreensis]|nr:hypothetical protein [Chitinimonas koreensis]
MSRPSKARPAVAGLAEAGRQLETRGAPGQADAPADRRPAQNAADAEAWLPRPGRAGRPVAEAAWQP